MMNQTKTKLQDYPFDLYQRTRDIREIVDIIARETGKKQLKILDVGGFYIDAEEQDDWLLREFLPQHEIVALDLVDSSIPGYVQGDGTQLPFKDQIFDVVVTSDVYEHIPAQKRKKFLENLLRVVKPDGFVILGAPFYSEKNVLAENILYEYIRKVIHAEQAQLKEHIKNQLPNADELKDFLNQGGVDHTCFDSGYLDNWLMMMMIKHYLMTIPGSKNLHSMLDRFYNMSFYESDHREPGYRKVFVITNGKTFKGILKKIEGHFTAYAETYKNSKPENRDLTHIRLLLSLEELRTRRFFQEKDMIIRQQAAQIDALNRMQSTRIYKLIQAFNKIFFVPVEGVFRFLAAKIQQFFWVFTGKRKYPLLSLSGWMYRRWIKKNIPTEEEKGEFRKKSRNFAYQPIISIVMPIYNTKQQWLEEAVASVKNQVYENWELCLVNDGSTKRHVREVPDHWKKQDQRIKIKHLWRNRGIAEASNQALAMATGEFIAFMDSDDVLHPMALFEVVSLLNDHPQTDVIYTDEDKLSLQGQRKKPIFKPGWSSELFLTYNYINHLTVCRKILIDQVGGFRPEFNWSQDYDLYLRITERTDKIFHIPKVLYHWRAVPGSSASKVDIRPEAQAKSIALLTETLHRRDIDGIVVNGLRPGTFKIKKIRR
jgi:glycosyltransferase involved in cell wall biosynthesis/SAM-dependent methyltransferase